MPDDLSIVRRTRLRATPAAIALALFAGCASRPPAGDPPVSGLDTGVEVAPSSIDSALEPLRTLSAKQMRRPDDHAKRAPLAPGVPEELMQPLPPEAMKLARMPLEEVLALEAAKGAATTQSLPAEPAAEEISDEDRLEATRSYVMGRARRLSGQFALAERDLKQSARLDPRSGSAWRELGELQAAQGNRIAAASSFRRVLALAPDDIRALEFLSRAALERREYSEAIGLLGRLRSLPIASFDAALPYIAEWRLGEALRAEGYLSASAGVMRGALELPPTFGSATLFQEELSKLYRQRGEIWRELGDVSTRLGEGVQAEQYYARAAALPSLNPALILSRRLNAAMKLGRPADAAILIVREIEASGGRVDDRLLTLIRHTAEHSKVGPLLSDAIASMRNELTDAEWRVAGSSIARARAAALDSPEAAAVLRERLRESPADGAAMQDLYRLFDPTNVGALVNETLLLIEASPLHEARYADAVLQRHGSSEGIRSAIARLPAERGSSPAARLLEARMAVAIGDFEGADAILTPATATAAPWPAAIVARTSILARLSRFDEARALLDALDSNTNPSVIDAHAAALAEIAEPREALDLLAPLLADESQLGMDTDRRLLAARLNLVLGQFEEAERLLQQVILSDPTRDEAFAALINMYGRSGPMHDDIKLIATLRTLRDANPSSPTLRWLRAQEAIGRKQYDLAERDLLDLAEEFPDRSGVVLGLVRLWLEQGRADEAQIWLRAQLERHPESSACAIALAEVLDRTGRRDEAIVLMEHRLAATPGDAEVSRALEQILRENPEQRRRADTLARARLARSGQHAEAFVELAELEASGGDLERAANAVRRAVEHPGQLHPELVNRLSKLATDLAEDALRGRRSTVPVRSIVYDIAEKIPGAPAPVFAQALRLLGRTGASVDRITAMVEQASRAHPGAVRRIEFFSTVIDTMLRPGVNDFPGEPRPKDAIAVLEYACTSTNPPPNGLASFWLILTWQPQSEHYDLDSLSRAVDHLRRTNTVEAVLQEFCRNLTDRTGQRPSTAEGAYFLGVMLGRAPRHADQSEFMYRTSLKLEPNHIWANNNLGYRLLEDDREIEAAAQMIETAYTAMMANPRLEERASIIDSLGWARYKLGILRDEVDAQGNLIREGAITLLRRSFELVKKNPELAEAYPIIADHLADASWAGGEREEAIELWADAQARAEAIILTLPQGAAAETVDHLEMVDVANSTKAKLLAASEDREPPLSMIHRGAKAPPPTPLAVPADPVVPAPDDPAVIIQ